MVFGFLADLVVVVHLAFVLFVAVGGLPVWRWPWLMWCHLPAVAWGIAIITIGFTCPLTPLEHYLRGRAGQQGHDGGFVDRLCRGRHLPRWAHPPGTGAHRHGRCRRVCRCSARRIEAENLHGFISASLSPLMGDGVVMAVPPNGPYAARALGGRRVRSEMAGWLCEDGTKGHVLGHHPKVDTQVGVRGTRGAKRGARR